uniref:TMEM131_like domain-containing protein n=1 Tax=Dracunculus medinensis TaxID=318479 RepID=A0A0N4UMJ2_DRAME
LLWTKMINNSLILILLINLFNFSYGTLSIVEGVDISSDNNNLPVAATAFVQTGNELHYFSDIQYHENLIGAAAVKSEDNEFILNNQLQFTPKELNFGEQPLGVPQILRVRIHNPTASKVRFDAISGSTIHFHCSFPEHKTIDAGETTFFDVVFLPRQESVIENRLFIHSSLGAFTYTVKGKGVSNPYRLRPFISARIPLNGTFVSSIKLHNPHSEMLLITEIYTSGGEIHLELPNMLNGMNQKSGLWEIEPFQTKTVINAKILGAHERNGTGFLKIKTGLKKNEKDGVFKSSSVEKFEENLIVPFEFETTKKRGVFSTVDILDFGLIKLGEKSSPIILEVFSTLEKGIEIESLYVEKIIEPSGIYMEFASKPPIMIKSGLKQLSKIILNIFDLCMIDYIGCLTKKVTISLKIATPIAKLLFDSTLLRLKPDDPRLIRFKGKIIAESRGGNYNVSVPYLAIVYSGTLTQRTNETTFHDLVEPPVSRSVTLNNGLPFGIAIWNVSVAPNAMGSFTVELVMPVVILGVDESRPVFLLKYVSKENDSFSSTCILHTNVSIFTIPIIIFNGRLKVKIYSIYQKEFNFGLLDLGDSRSIQFVISNENPVPVTIKKLKKAMSAMSSLRLLNIASGNATDLKNSQNQVQQNSWQEGLSLELPAQSFAVFEYSLTVKSQSSDPLGLFMIETDFEQMSFPVVYKLEKGSIILNPDHILFGNVFPGKICFKNLQVYSTFQHDMQLLRLSTLSYDPRIHFEKYSASNIPVVRADQITDLGRVFVIPEAICKDDCYVGVPLHTADGQWFTYGIRLPQNLAEIDYYLYKKLRKKFLMLKANNELLINTTIVVDTQEVMNLFIPIQIEFIWPRLLTKSVVDFPLTAVGNFTIVNLTLTNPSSLPIVVQLLPLVIYPDAEALVEFFRDELPSPLFDPIEVNETLMFSLRDTELFTLKQDSPVPKLREELEGILGTSIPKFTLSMLLQPGMKVRVRVGFLPSDYTLRSSLLNNLTIIEPVILYGRGARMDMQVDGHSARTLNPLMFEIQGHHLADCHNPKRLTHKLFTTLTVKRSFVVANTGEVPFTVVNMSLNNVPCENRGFRILNCHMFQLAPNETYILDIAYTPDFLMSWNEAALQFYMHMNGTSWLFPIGASIPKHMLAKCHAALPRPPFESIIFCLICVVACAYLEGDRTITCAIKQQYAQTRRVFDLNALDGDFSSITDKRQNALNSKSPIRSSPRRHVLHYAKDSNILIRSFWQTANGVLWLFSFIWQFRNDQVPSSQAKSVVSKNDEIICDQEKLERCQARESSLVNDTISEAGLSDSGAPEWINTSPINMFDYDVEDDYNALVSASELLFDSQIPFRRLHVEENRVPVCSCEHTNYRDTFHSSEYQLLNKPDGRQPSAFMQQLQRERKVAEAKYLAERKMENFADEILEEPNEIWPGFNLSFSSITPGFFDSDSGRKDNSESIWQLPGSSSTSKNSPEDLSNAVRSFRLNPEAPPFISANTRLKQQQIVKNGNLHYILKNLECNL